MDGQFELTWVTYPDRLPAHRWLPIQVLTGRDVKQVSNFVDQDLRPTLSQTICNQFIIIIIIIIIM